MSKSEARITFRRCVEKKSGSVILASNSRGADPDRGSMQSFRKYEIIAEDGLLTVPDEFTAIEAFAFEECDGIPNLEIVLPESVASIGWGAFQGLENLKSVKLPKALKVIPNYSFNNCTSIAHIEIPDKVEKIEQEAFAGCSNLKTIALPPRLKKIGPYAFSGCCFEKIVLPESNSIFTAEGGLLMSKSREKVFAAENRPEGIIIPPEVTSVSKGIFVLHKNVVLIIPGAWPKALTKEIKANQIKEIRTNDIASLPKTLAKLAVPLGAAVAKEDNSLDNWKLPTEDREAEIVTVPEGMTELRKGMFRDAKNMKELNVPDSVQRICTGAFEGTDSLKNIRIGKGIQEIEADAFPEECRVQDIYFACSSEQVRISPITSVDNLEWKALLHFENVEPRTLGGLPLPKNISVEEAKLLFVVKKSNKSGTYSIEVPNGGGYFGNKIRANYTPTVGKCIGEFCYGVTDTHISVPETIMGAPIEKVSVGMFPANAIIYCTPEIFVKTAKSIRAETSVAWLEGDPLFTEAQAECIREFIQKNSIDVCECLLRSNSIEAHTKFAHLAKVKPAMLDKLIEAEYSNAEIRAFWLSQKNNKSAKKEVDLFSLDVPKQATKAELKRLWNFYEDSDHAGITAYKGNEQHVTVPAYIGNLPVTRFAGDNRSFFGKGNIESITFENPDIEFEASLRDCTKLADENGFIIITLGDRRILTDYIGESNVIHVPDGVTDVLWDAFGIVKDPPRVYSWQIDSIEVHLPASVQRFMDWNLFSSSWRDFFNTEQYCAVHVHNPDMKIEAVAPEGKNIIYAAKGSFAEAFAQSHGMEFVVE